MDITVIICCYNSEELIRATLEHVSKQQLEDDLKVEVILVNNNSSDNTKSLARKVWEEQERDFTLKIVDEPRPGLSHARRAGVSESSSEILIFCDDDNWLAKDYCQLSYDFMKDNEQVGILGAQTIGVLEAAEPAWWQEKSVGYAVGRQNQVSGDVTEKGYVWGAGMVIRKTILEKLFAVGFESFLTGRNGEKLSSGDDNEICKWAILLGYRLHYLENLKLEHFITKRRLTDDYVKSLYEGHAESNGTLHYYTILIEELRKKKSRMGWFYRIKSIFQFLKARLSKDENLLAVVQVHFGTNIEVHRTSRTILKFYHKVMMKTQ